MAKKRPQSAPAGGSTSQPSTPRIRIVERPSDFKGVERLVFAEASSLDNNPKNWKTHDDRQVSSLDGEFSTVGWAGAMLYNLTTGLLIDGHGRKQTRYVKKHGIVPVLIGRWTKEEERQILLHMDPIGAMYQADREKYRELMDDYQKQLDDAAKFIEPDIHQALDQINQDLELRDQSLDYGAPSAMLPSSAELTEEIRSGKAAEKAILGIDELPPSPPGSAYTLKTWMDIPFDSYGTSGILDIPPIRPDLIPPLPTGEMIPWVGPETNEADSYLFIYGSAAIEKVRTHKMVVAFYTYDQKFEAVWNDPRTFTARMLQCNILAAISPNFSHVTHGPAALAAWQTYRSRWLGRYWQEAGLKVIPDLQIPDHREKRIAEIMLAGIPKDAPCIATQLQTRGDQDNDTFYTSLQVDLLHALDKLKPKGLLAYCGTALPATFFNRITIPVTIVKSWMSERRKVLRKKTRDGEYMQSKNL